MSGWRDMLAVVRTDPAVAVWVVDGRLPVLPGESNWPSLAELETFAELTGLLPLAPAVRLDGMVLHLLRCTGPPGNSVRGEWLPPARVEHGPRIARAVEEWAGRLDRPALRPDWYRAGWLAEIDEWIDAALPGLGRTRTAGTEVVQMWNLAAVLRVPCAGGPLYAKASCRHFHAEPAITALIGRWSSAVPAVRAVDAERAWMIMDPLPATDEDDEAVVIPAAAELARVQIGSRSRLPDLAAAGCPDRSLARTVAGYERLLREGVELTDLSAAEVSAAHAALPGLRASLAELQSCGLPDTLLHGDLHRGNVAGDAAAVQIAVLYDWSDACLGHPALDLHHLTARVSEEVRERAVAAYRAEWAASGAGRDADFETALRLAPVADRMFQAISYEGIVRSIEPAARWPVGGMVAKNVRALSAGGAADFT